MEKEQALQIIEQALNITIGKNVFKAEDSATILTAFITIKNSLSFLDKEVIEEKIETPIEKSK